MASNVTRLDDLPTRTGNESVPEQIQALYDYLFVLRQTLEYLLSNLSQENFNPTALQSLTDHIGKQLPAAQAVNKTASGYELGAQGKELNLLGTIYINGVLFRQEETNETT